MNKIMNEIHEKATFYLGDLYGYDRIEACDVSWIFEPHAQYLNAIRVEYTVRGKRETAVITKTPLVILDGWGHPDPPPKWSQPKLMSENIAEQTTRRLSCDPEWQNEFNAFLNGYLAGSNATVLSDFRKHKIKKLLE